jgi:hypothetical protein
VHYSNRLFEFEITVKELYPSPAWQRHTWYPGPVLVREKLLSRSNGDVAEGFGGRRRTEDRLVGLMAALVAAWDMRLAAVPINIGSVIEGDEGSD